MAINTVTPAMLAQAQYLQKQRGTPGDYYGINESIQGLNRAFLGANQYIDQTNNAYRNNATTQAQIDNDYFNRKGALDSINLDNQTYDAQHKKTMRDAVQEAHQAATAAGLTIGTPQHDLFMRDYLSKHADYQTAVGAVAPANKAITQIQSEGFAKGFLKKAIENDLTRRLATEIYQRSIADQSLPDDQKKVLAQQAMQQAQDHMAQVGVQVNIGPDGTIVASDATGQTIPISPQQTAMTLYALGDKVPVDALKIVDDATRKRLADLRANDEQARKDTATDTKGATGGTALPLKADPRLADANRMITGLRSDLRQAVALDSKEGQEGKHQDDIDRIRSEIARYTQWHDKLMGMPSVNAVAAAPTFDPNSAVGQAVGGAGTSGPPKDYLYGGEMGDETGSGFPDTQEAAPIPPPAPSITDRISNWWGSPTPEQGAPIAF